MAEQNTSDLHFATKASQRHKIKGPITSVSIPIVPSSTYVLDNAQHGATLSQRKQVSEDQSPYLYTRWANPTTDVAAEVVRDLEGGYAAILTASGMSSIISVFWTFLKAGDHVVAPLCVYGGTHEYLKNILSKFAVEVSWVDSTDVNNYKTAIKSNTKILYGETPANPTIKLLDLKEFAKIGKSHSILTVVDSTFASPYNQNPLKHGIDIVVHSATKYLGGHSDLTAGAVVCSTKEQHHQLSETMRLLGSTLSAFDSFLLYKGMKTLDVRMERHNSNALTIAKFLEQHPKISRVYYPFLESHPQHALALKQMKGGSGMIAFEVKGGVDAGKTLIENVKLITLAVSLGGVESLIEHAASMTHTEVSREQRLQGGITDGLIRFSVGLEDHRDLIADLTQALEHVKAENS